MTVLRDDMVLVRGLDVTARMSATVAELSDLAEGGILLETLIGRYVLDSDARTAWLLIDGRRTVGQLVDSVAEASGEPAGEVRQPTYELCEQLLGFGLVDVATPADIDALIR